MVALVVWSLHCNHTTGWTLFTLVVCDLIPGNVPVSLFGACYLPVGHSVTYIRLPTTTHTFPFPAPRASCAFYVYYRVTDVYTYGLRLPLSSPTPLHTFRLRLPFPFDFRMGLPHTTSPPTTLRFTTHCLTRLPLPHVTRTRSRYTRRARTCTTLFGYTTLHRLLGSAPARLHTATVTGFCLRCSATPLRIP